MAVLKVTDALQPLKNGLNGPLSEGFVLSAHMLEPWLLRLAVAPQVGLAVGRSWMIAPGDDAPWQGRDRLAQDGFSCPSVEAHGDGFVSGDTRLRIERDPFRICIERRLQTGAGPDWQTVLEDRPHSAWRWSESGQRLTHYQALQPGEAHYGLGDKSGPLDRTGRRLRCLQSDALGYDAELSDPLYKHAPFVIASAGGNAVGLLYDTMAETTFDLGAEHSNYFPRYRHVECQERGVILYVIFGSKLADVVVKLHRLTGRPAFLPRWSLGFAFTSMHHADDDNAQSVIMDFAREARQRELPISAIHLGSGYTAGLDGLRYVFNWNESRFPDRSLFFDDLKALGYRSCANIKPVLLTGHARFEEARQHGWFVRSGDGKAAIEAFWGGQGSNLDFTNPDTVSFWKNGVTDAVLGAGFDAAWNDNNEAELWDEEATLAGFGNVMPGMQARPVQALLMTRSSCEATLAHRPEERPFTISRAGPIGIARYGETWSGDNRTSWHTLKWNLRQGLSMSLSGMPFVGHDVGGFVGPPPDAELLTRWFQMMALHPRCVMNSWKPDYNNVPNLPWMHEDAFAAIKDALTLRYRFLPLIYHLVWRAHETGHPVIAPTLFHFDEQECRDDADTFMLGDDVLVAPVVEDGARIVRPYLPGCDHGWVEFWSGARFCGGSMVEIEAPLSRLPVLVRAGAVLPLAAHWPDHAPHDADQVTMTVFPGDGEGEMHGTTFFDDGIGWGYRDGAASLVAHHFNWSGDDVQLHLDEQADATHRPPLDVSSVDGTGRKVHASANFALVKSGR
ncbi:MAG: glycoside hydrolase family 31 protein [Ahrensia sp.]|nr:glycoside hydrolase family 31 protein [Ahrensia sp.]